MMTYMDYSNDGASFFRVGCLLRARSCLFSSMSIIRKVNRCCIYILVGFAQCEELPFISLRDK